MKALMTRATADRGQILHALLLSAERDFAHWLIYGESEESYAYPSGEMLS
jgi:hypothetical protein